MTDDDEPRDVHHPCCSVWITLLDPCTCRHRERRRERLTTAERIDQLEAS